MAMDTQCGKIRRVASWGVIFPITIPRFAPMDQLSKMSLEEVEELEGDIVVQGKLQASASPPAETNDDFVVSWQVVHRQSTGSSSGQGAAMRSRPRQSDCSGLLRRRAGCDDEHCG